MLHGAAVLELSPPQRNMKQLRRNLRRGEYVVHAPGSRCVVRHVPVFDRRILRENSSSVCLNFSNAAADVAGRAAEDDGDGGVAGVNCDGHK